MRVTPMITSLKDQVAFLLLTNKSFRLFRWFGVHVTRVHFYSPVPDIRELARQPDLWKRNSQMPGVQMNPREQQRFMEEAVTTFQPECDFPRDPAPDPHQYYSRNTYFGYVSAVALHTMVRQFRPTR